MIKHLLIMLLIAVPLFSHSGELEWLKLLPKEYEGFKHVGYEKYPEGLGYSSRYTMPEDESVFIDIYIWPVGQAEETMRHQELVKSSTQAAINGIKEMFKAKGYNRFEIIRDMSKFNDVMSITSLNILLVKENGADLSWLSLTEVDGYFIKFRATYEYKEGDALTKPVMLFGTTMLSNLLPIMATPNQAKQLGTH